ncbi:hypothetical protein BDW71DRAFT_213828 [Aspergillus fruticulosus]
MVSSQQFSKSSVKWVQFLSGSNLHLLPSKINPPPLDLHYSVSSTANELAGGLPGSSFNPERDVSDPSGKAIFVTGETVLQLVRHRPERIYLAARTATKAQTAVASIRETLPHPANIRHIPLDLALFASIRAPAKQFQSECDRLDILILKAGVMAHSPSLTEEGYEIHLGTNHIGHFLIKLPLPTPREKFSRYGASKAANVLFAAELTWRHPGAAVTDLYHQSKKAGFFYETSVALMMKFFRGIHTGVLTQI